MGRKGDIAHRTVAALVLVAVSLTLAALAPMAPSASAATVADGVSVPTNAVMEIRATACPVEEAARIDLLVADSLPVLLATTTSDERGLVETSVALPDGIAEGPGTVAVTCGSFTWLYEVVITGEAPNTLILPASIGGGLLLMGICWIVVTSVRRERAAEAAAADASDLYPTAGSVSGRTTAPQSSLPRSAEQEAEALLNVDPVQAAKSLPVGEVGRAPRRPADSPGLATRARAWKSRLEPHREATPAATALPIGTRPAAGLPERAARPTATAAPTVARLAAVAAREHCSLWAWDVGSGASSTRRVACLTDTTLYLSEVAAEAFPGLVDRLDTDGVDAALSDAQLRLELEAIEHLDASGTELKLTHRRNGSARAVTVDLSSAADELIAALSARLPSLAT